MEVSGQLHAPAVLPPVSIGWDAGGAPDQFGSNGEEKRKKHLHSPCWESNPWPSHYTDCTTLAPT